MYKEMKILSQRQDELTRMYGVYGTNWEDDWSSYYFLKSDLSFCREKYANRHEIFEVFKYFALWVGLTMIGVIFAVINKNALIAISWAFGSAILVSIIYYLVYYVFYKNKRTKLEHVIGPYYIKYDEATLKQYLKNDDYRPPYLPPRPKAPLFSDTYFVATDEDEEEETRREARSKKKSKDDAESKPIISVEDEPVAEEKIDEVEEVPRDEAAEEEPKHGLGIDLRLVGNDDKAGGSNNAQPAVVSDSEPIPDREDTAPQTDEEGDCSREPEPTVSETPEEGTEVEAVRVIDAELPDRPDNRDNTASETVETVSEEDVSSQRLKDLAFLFESKPKPVEETDEEGLPEDQRFVVDDFYDELSDDDYSEDDEDIIEDEIGYEDEDEDEVESEDEVEEETEAESDDEAGDENDDASVEEDGGRLFAEDYMPTTDELLAALRMLRDS